MRQLALLSSLFLLLVSMSAHAQDITGDTSDRIEQMEQDILLLKRQQERLRMSGNAASSSANDDGESGADAMGTAQTNVRISALEQELKMLHGQLEEKDFANRKLAEDLERFKRDSEFRLNELEKSLQALNTAPPAANTTNPAENTPDAAPEASVEGKKKSAPAAKKEAKVSVKEVEVKNAATDDPHAATTADGEEEAPAPTTGDTPRDHYNYAFRLLNQNQYDDAAKSFASFVKKFPKDPLVGNAYYWQGETYYIRKDYTKAADHFRQGFESLPKGPKAADNLLKLGMSLGALKKKDEACIVLSQVVEKFKTVSANVAGKAQAEHKRLSCE